MKSNRLLSNIFCALLLLAAASLVAQELTRFNALPGSKVTIDGTGNHPWTVESQIIAGHLEIDPAFPARTNVEFVRVLDRGRVVARIWERGVGETASSGTGGAACAVAARLRGAVDPDVDVALPGGVLRIRWEDEGEPVIMTGPARVLFEVEVDVDVLG